MVIYGFLLFMDNGKENGNYVPGDFLKKAVL